MADIGADETIEWITAACRVASIALPRGERGVEAALLWLQAFPLACGLGLGDVTESAPGLFRVFVGVGLLVSCPSDGAMTGAIRLVASVSPLVSKRSPRTWTAWIGSACDPASAVAAALRGAVTPAMLREPKVPTAAPRRVGSIRGERDRLAADLTATRGELEQTRRSSSARIGELSAERDRLASDLRAAAERQRANAQDLARSTTTLTEVREALATCRLQLEEAERRRVEAADSARKQGEQARAAAAARDQLRADLDRKTKRAAALNEELTAVAAERDEHVASLKTANDSLASDRAELQSVRAALVREAAAHAETRKQLQNADLRRLSVIQEHERMKAQERERLDAATTSAEAATKAIADICRWLDIDPERHTALESRLEAIIATILRRETTRQRFVHRVEAKLTRVYTKLIVARLEVKHHREGHPGTQFETYIERLGDEIAETAEARAKSSIDALTDPEDAELQDE